MAMNGSTMEIKKSNCPVCGKEPESWKAQLKHGSRELNWIGCKKCGKLEGGITEGIAAQNWNRMSARVKYDRRFL